MDSAKASFGSFLPTLTVNTISLRRRVQQIRARRRPLLITGHLRALASHCLAFVLHFSDSNLHIWDVSSSALPFPFISLNHPRRSFLPMSDYLFHHPNVITARSTSFSTFIDNHAHRASVNTSPKLPTPPFPTQTLASGSSAGRTSHLKPLSKKNYGADNAGTRKIIGSRLGSRLSIGIAARRRLRHGDRLSPPAESP